MRNSEFETRINELKWRAHGRWTAILLELGINEKILNRRNQPCPMCGGTDRFRYTDKFGEGNYHCHRCGPGAGFKLLQGCLGWDFGTAFRRVEECVGSVTLVPKTEQEGPSQEWMKRLAKKLWNEAVPVTPGDEVDRYLHNRGLHLSRYPKTIRFHPHLGYYEKEPASGKSKKVRDYAAMLACIQDTDGQMVTLHRTYLQDGCKALGSESKKLLSGGMTGAAVRLFDPTDELAIAEGIETALAVSLSTGKPAWAAICAGNMEKMWIPESVRRICIYADNDADSQFDGQASAFILARRLKKEEKNVIQRHIDVFIPKIAGHDWADVWLAHSANTPKAA